MLTVGQLRALLAEIPADVPVCTMTIVDLGATVDLGEAEALGIDVTAYDDGTPKVVWITSVSTNLTPAQPPFVSWLCRCGETVITTQDDELPLAHLVHLNSRTH